MATFDVASSNITTTASATTVTASHTIAAQANAGLVAVGAAGIASDGGKSMSCTYNGVSGTSLGAVHSNNGTAGFITGFWWPIGTGDGTAHNLVLTISSGILSGEDLMVHGLSFYGVVQTTPTATTGFGSASPSLAVSSQANSIVAWLFGSGNTIAGATQTERTNQGIGTPTACGFSETQTAVGATTVTAAYTDNADWWSAIGVNLQNAGAAGATATPAAISVIGGVPQATGVNLGGPVALRGPITSGVRLA